MKIYTSQIEATMVRIFKPSERIDYADGIETLDLAIGEAKKPNYWLAFFLKVGMPLPSSL